MTTPRALAYELLQKAEKNDQFLNIALDHALNDSDMSESDRKLAAILVYGVTERRLTLDYQLSHLSSRPVQDLDLGVLTACRIGLYQLIYLDRIPPHAAIYETVALVPKRCAGFVNAILRAFTRDPRICLPNPEKVGASSYLSVAYSVCLPLAEKLLSVFGHEQAEAILAAFGHPPAIHLSVNTLRISAEELAVRIPDALPSPIVPNGLSVHGSVRRLYGFEEGCFFVQDEASRICVEALGAEPDEIVMDICSCPGSKSFGSALRMKNRGQIHAYDLHAKKLSLVESSAERLGITILKTMAHDGRDFLPEMEGVAHRVLCDVPCSGFGVLGKKPELRYKNPAQSAALPAIQRAILETACRYVRSGGVLVYSTCTIFPEENEENIRAFLSAHPEFSLSPFTAGTLDVPSGMITLLPNEHPTDGFFIARLVKQ